MLQSLFTWIFYLFNQNKIEYFERKCFNPYSPGFSIYLAKALNMTQDKQKDTAGKALIKYFSMPCTATKTNGGRLRNLPRHDPDKWKLYLDYCGQDVVAEMAVPNTFSSFELPEKEWELWRLDILMNEKGVEIDRQLVENAISIDNLKKKGLLEEAKRITDLASPARTGQVLKWLQEQG